MIRHSSCRTSASGQIAKERLLQMMLEEHTQCSQELLDYMEQDLLHVLSKYIPVSEDNFHLFLKRGRDTTLLLAATRLSLQPSAFLNS